MIQSHHFRSQTNNKLSSTFMLPQLHPSPWSLGATIALHAHNKTSETLAILTPLSSFCLPRQRSTNEEAREREKVMVFSYTIQNLHSFPRKFPIYFKPITFFRHVFTKKRQMSQCGASSSGLPSHGLYI